MKRLLICLLLVLISLSAATSGMAITATVCSPKITTRYYTAPITIQKSMCVQNDNAYPATVNFSASDEISSMVSFSDTSITLAVGEKKFVPFEVAIGQDSAVSGTINAIFSVPQDPSGFTYFVGSATLNVVKGECDNGQTQACTADANCTGTETCTDYLWKGLCVKNDPSCGCIENWTCSDYGACINGIQSRTCRDLNNCGTNATKPLLNQGCGGTCSENWSCQAWSICQANNTQTRICADSNHCGSIVNRPALTQTCNQNCVENWKCGSWSACQPAGIQTRTCTDNNNCGTTTNKSALSRACTYGGGSSGGGGGGGGGGGSSGGGGGGSSSLSESKSIPNIGAGMIGSVEFSTEGLYITKIQIALLNATSADSRISIREAELPNGATLPVQSDGKVLQYIQISRINIPTDSIGSATINFKVNKTEIDKKNFTVEDIGLMRYLDEKAVWQKLNTSLIREDANYAYYSAASPGFSVFAIVTEKAASVPESAGAATAPATQVNKPEQKPAVAANTSDAAGNGQPGGGAGNTAAPATGFAIKDLPRNSTFVGIVVVVLVASIAIILVKSRSSSKIELR